MLKFKRSSAFYIDLGTANTLVYERKRGFLLREPTVLAYRDRLAGSEFLASGNTAKKMIGKTPDNIRVNRPLREGVIADFEGTTVMLRHFFEKIRQNRFFYKPTMVISLPYKVSNFEAEAVQAVGKDLGAGEVRLIDEPVAAALGAGLSIMEKRATVIVDIGGGTSEVAILASGGIILAEAIRIGGDDIDRAITDLIRSQLNFLIGEQTAEKLKMEMGSALFDGAIGFAEVRGLDLEKGLPCRRHISANFIYPAINLVIKQVLVAVHAALEKAPPEVSADLYDAGIVLAGGGALLNGLAQRFEMEFGIKTYVAEDPLGAVAQGGAKAVEDFNILERMTT